MKAILAAALACTALQASAQVYKCSKGFPLAKVIEYVRLRRPFCVNDIPSQVVLENRYDIYGILERAGIPTPRHLYVDRSKLPHPVVVEHPDYIEIDGVRIDKPLVEKPYDGEDHNVTIYYGQKNGGGSRRLFRKIGNRSSRFYPKVNSLRKDGSYIYESLLMQGKVSATNTRRNGRAHCQAPRSSADLRTNVRLAVCLLGRI